MFAERWIQTMKLSCITTVFNDGKPLLNSVNSVLNQTFEDFQYIIVDDGSDAATRAVLAGITDPRVVHVRQANAGLSTARNTGLAHAEGEYVCFLDADDVRPNWSFQAIAGKLAQDDPDLLICRGTLSEATGELLPFYDTPVFREIEGLVDHNPVDAEMLVGRIVYALAQQLEPQSANKVVRMAMLREAGLGFPDGHFFEDIYFHTLALSHAKRVSFLHSPCFTYFHRYQRSQITGTSGTRRFDIVAVTKLTLEMVARRPEFADPLRRAAIVGACLKIVQWCESTISHLHRPAYRDLVRSMLRMIDPAFLEFPRPLPSKIPSVEAAQAYIDALFGATPPVEAAPDMPAMVAGGEVGQ